VDDGLGIADLDTLHRSGHLGLIGMRERAVAIGAKLDIQSSPESGATMTLRWGIA
jgi:signal transduction histidine kinase